MASGTATSRRMTRLLQATADGCRDGIAPLSHEFLVEHDVTADEALSLADAIAGSIELLLAMADT